MNATMTHPAEQQRDDDSRRGMLRALLDRKQKRTLAELAAAGFGLDDLLAVAREIPGDRVEEPARLAG